nr:hypothetical protein BaRGS_007857 [Batillaria attramentaria]
MEDFEDSGVWAAQTELEAVQKAEEDELYAEIRAERQHRLRRLEDELQHEMETTVNDLVTTFERFSPQKGKTKLQRETERIEEQYRRKKEEKCRKMLERLSSEQRARVASLIQKHSQQMLELIAEKLTSLEERSSSESESRSPIMDLSRAPPPSPPEFKRAQLFKSPGEFAKIDNHVFEIARRHYSSFSGLVKDLIVDCETDLEKARAIFRWVTLADLNEMEFADSESPESPLGLLRGIKFGTETYHDLCRRLCSYAGLHCEVIQGYSKGAGYKPGMKLEGSRFRNSWTAVCIDGSWCFLNCNWGARHVRAASNDSGNPTSTHHHHDRSYHPGHGRRRRGSCAKENIDCKVNSGGGGGVAGGGVGDGDYHGGVSVTGCDPHNHHHNNGNVIVTTTAAQSCVDAKHIVDNNNDNDHSLLRFGREKDSPLRQLFRYASGDILTARNGDRNSSNSASDSHNGSNGCEGCKGGPGGWPAGEGTGDCKAGDKGRTGNVEGDGGSEREGRQRYHYQCDEFYFMTDPEDHIFQHYPDDPEWQLLECPITLSEFINLPVLKSPFFNYGLKLATHYDCKQVTESGLVNVTLRIPHLLGFGYTLEPKDKRMNPYILEGRVMLRIVGHKAIFTVAPPKRGRFYFTIYAKDDWLSESLQSACAFQIRCKEGRETLRSPYPKVSFFGPTPSAAMFGLLPQTHIDPVVTYSHEDMSFHFQLPRHVRLSYSLQFHGQAPDAVDADFQRYVFLRQRDDNSISFLVRCPHVGKYVFALYGSRVDSPEDSSVSGNGNPNTPALPYECLFRYLIECKQSATNKAPYPRACHRWYQSHLLEPMVGDLDCRAQHVKYSVFVMQVMLLLLLLLLLMMMMI